MSADVSTVLSLAAKPFPSHVALLGNAPPRQCGIATYTKDSFDALAALPTPPAIDLYVMDDGKGANYDDGIACVIPDEDRSAYSAAARQIDASGADILWVQHEFGIFGGEAGDYLLDLIDAVSIPVAISLHTILETPDPAQRRVMRRLTEAACTIIVMAEKGRDILVSTYGVDPRRIHVIPHGAPDRPLVPTADAKARLGLEARPTILTFGLLSPGKGIEDMIRAMPAVASNVPDALYVILGATHPNLVAREGNAYRESLVEMAEAYGVSDNVTLVDRYTELDELLDWLAAADVYVTPYLNPAQITSGTLSYAVALGKPVVSTPYSHASELLGDGLGSLVPFASPRDLAAAVSDLLSDEGKRLTMAERAYARGRTMIWSSNARAVMAAMREGLALSGVAEKSSTPCIAPLIRLSSIERLTDGTGMLQHSVGGIADRRHGYCIDDNARALMLVTLADDIPLERRLALFSTYASFVQHAWNEETASFRNFMAFDRSWLEETGSEDSNGRTLWALGLAAHRAPTLALRNWAQSLFEKTSAAMAELASPRACAFAILGAVEMLAAEPGHAPSNAIVSDGVDLLTRLLVKERRPDWRWFEVMLSYDNTRLPEALMRGGRAIGNSNAVACGLDALEWISQQTTTRDGVFSPVGTQSFGVPFARPAVFDQQPVEAWAMIDACAAASEVSEAQIWTHRAKAAHDWFLGANIHGVAMIDPLTGDCFDGLTPDGVNTNHGAESVLAWQLAHRAYRASFGMPGNVFPSKVLRAIA